MNGEALLPVLASGLLGGGFATIAALIAARVQRQQANNNADANRTDASRAQSEITARTLAMYKDLLAEKDGHIAMLRNQNDHANHRYNNELATSDSLRHQLRALTNQLESIQATVERLHSETVERPLPPPIAPGPASVPTPPVP